jgi:hypothetical protein
MKNIEFRNDRLLNFTGITRELVTRSQGFRRDNMPKEIKFVLDALDDNLDEWKAWAKDHIKKERENKAAARREAKRKRDELQAAKKALHEAKKAAEIS